MADQTHVLFVEDDDVIREATQLALERDGFAVTAMPDGLSGLAAVVGFAAASTSAAMVSK